MSTEPQREWPMDAGWYEVNGMTLWWPAELSRGERFRDSPDSEVIYTLRHLENWPVPCEAPELTGVSLDD